MIVYQINEASNSLTPVEKMRLFDAGNRRENVKACGDAKLLEYLAICLRYNFTHAEGEIRHEIFTNREERIQVQAENTIIQYKKLFDLDNNFSTNYLYKSFLTSAEFKKAIAKFLSDPSESIIEMSVLPIVYFSLSKVRQAVVGIFILFISELASESAASDVAKKWIKEKLAGTVYTNQVVTDSMQEIINNDKLFDQIVTCYNDIISNYMGQSNSGVQENLEEDIEKHDELNPKLFNADNTLKEEVRQKVEEIVTAFTEDLAKEEIKIAIDDIILVGSNVSYNYTKDSDLDIHIIANTEGTSCPDNLYPKLYSAYRSLFNKKHDISFYGIPVEIYVETEDTKLASNGIYSVRNNTWIKEPVKEDIPDIDMEEFDAAFAEWENRYNNTINEDESAIEQFIEDIYELRHQGIATDGEYSIGNLVFKAIRSCGWLDNLKDLQNQEESKELSLGEPANAKDKLAVISDLIKDEEEAIAGYEQAIKDVKGLENEKEMSDRFEEISDDEKEHIKELKDLFELNFEDRVTEKLDNRALLDLKNKLNNIAHSQVILQPSGLFTIYLVKETDVDNIISQLKRLPEIMQVYKTPGKFDFSQVPIPGRPPKRYYTISGKVKI